MKAPGPPPTIPRRSLRRIVVSYLPSTVILDVLSWTRRLPREAPGGPLLRRSAQPKHPAIARHVRRRRGEVVECAAHRFDNMALNKGRTFGRSLLRALDAAFPFQYGPAVESVLGELGKDTAEIHLSVAQRPKSASAIDPILKTAVDAHPPG